MGPVEQLRVLRRTLAESQDGFRSDKRLEDTDICGSRARRTAPPGPHPEIRTRSGLNVYPFLFQ